MLVLVPTALELDRLVPELAPWSPSAPPRSWRTMAHGERVDVVACGFGQASAGARAAALMLRHDGSAVLAGLAGTLDSTALPVGCALVASSVVPHGIGVGEGSRHAGVEALTVALRQEIAGLAPAAPCVPATRWPPGTQVGALLSVTSASSSREEARFRQSRHPGCVAEEMEAHAVLHAAAACGTDVTVLRGISNVAGERDPARWDIGAAMESVRKALDAWLFP